MSFYPASQEMIALKERYRKHGLMLEGTKVKELNLDGNGFGSYWMLSALLSMSSLGWDTMSYNGQVKTHWFGIGRERVLLPDQDVMLDSVFLFCGPLAMMFARLPTSNRKEKRQ